MADGVGDVITWTDVVNIAAELSTVPLAAQTAILADVALEIDADVWGDLFDTGSKYLAAHIATVRARRGPGGQVVGESVGGVSRQYAKPMSVTPDALGTTGYGAEYERLLMTLPAVRFTVV